MSGKQEMKRYPKAIKVEVIRLFYEEGRTRKQITAQLNIRNEDTVKKWVRTYRRKGMEGLVCEAIGRPKKKETAEAAEGRIRYLEMENELLRNFLYGVERR